MKFLSVLILILIFICYLAIWLDIFLRITEQKSLGKPNFALIRTIANKTDERA